MPATAKLRSYTKQHVTITGPDGNYLGTELDAVSSSITTIIEYLKSVDPTTHIVTVANLPAAAANKNVRGYMVTNATATTFWSIVAGGGANIVPVISDGTNWRIG